MLLYQNGRFHALGVSFVLPDGFILDTVAGFTAEHAFAAFSPDERYYVEWQIEAECHGTRKELEELFLPGLGIKPRSTIIPFEVNGLSGHYAIYRANERDCLEFRLAVDGDTEISVRIMTQTEDIFQTKDEPFVEEISRFLRMLVVRH